MAYANVAPRAFFLPGMRFQKSRRFFLGHGKRQALSVDEDGKRVVWCVLIALQIVSLWLQRHDADHKRGAPFKRFDVGPISQALEDAVLIKCLIRLSNYLE